jgi:hypothetical protein
MIFLDFINLARKNAEPEAHSETSTLGRSLSTAKSTPQLEPATWSSARARVQTAEPLVNSFSSISLADERKFSARDFNLS